MTGIQHNRPDGTSCLSLAVTSCSECGWTEPVRDGEEPIVITRDDLLSEWRKDHPAECSCPSNRVDTSCPQHGTAAASPVLVSLGQLVAAVQHRAVTGTLEMLEEQGGSPEDLASALWEALGAARVAPGHVLVSREDLRAVLVGLEHPEYGHEYMPPRTKAAYERLAAAAEATP